MSAEHKKAVQGEEGGGGESAPLWYISFADMISLLMAFFVMLSSFSSYDKEEMEMVRKTMRYALRPCGGWFQKGDSMAGVTSSVTNELEGAQTPTLEDISNKKPIGKTGTDDFRTHRVFLADSQMIFYSSGVSLTAQGQQWLNTVAQYMARMPSRLLISERGTGADGEKGLKRAVCVAEYLCRHGIDGKNLNVTTRGTLPDSNFAQGRKLEICLLEEGIYQ
jgi:outer membrane protein OmpA-like peptidoglycan-associated protein